MRVPRTATGRRRAVQGGFTLIEMMIALTVLLIGITGILSMQITSLHATAYSRHATEASVLAEDKMEELRTMPVTAIVDDTEANLDPQGDPVTGGLYTRTWTRVDGVNVATITVTVSWLEQGNEPHAIVLRTQRQL